MHLFRSEEHVQAWTDFDPDGEAGIKPVADLAALFSRPLFRLRLEPDYILQLRDLVPGYLEGLAQLGEASPFWSEKPPA